MTIDNKIRDEKLQYDIEKISALSGKIVKYEYLAREEILPSNRNQLIEQAKFTSYRLGKSLKKIQRSKLIYERNLLLEDEGQSHLFNELKDTGYHNTSCRIIS